MTKPNLENAINHGKLLYSIYEEERYRITISEKFSKYKIYNITFRLFLILKTILNFTLKLLEKNSRYSSYEEALTIYEKSIKIFNE